MKDFVTQPRSADQELPQASGFRRWRTAELISNRWFVHRVLPPSHMSAVYFCFDTKLGQPMVVKSLPPTCLSDTTALKRFVAECEAWVRLGHHRNIARAYFVEVVNDYPYVFIEWIDGKDVYNAGLNAWIGTPSLSIERTIDIAAQVCDGMSHATAVLAKDNQVFVHCDIKPSNILITDDWTAKVTDFGIAKVRFLDRPSRAIKVDAVETTGDVTGPPGEHGEFVGTPPYMSPEHFADPNSVDRRSDIYSLGCTIFEMVAGRPVFDSDSWEDWREAHVGWPAPRLRSIRPDVPGYVDELVACCLAKCPAARPQSFAELKERLFLRGEHVATKKVETGSFSDWMHKGTSLDCLGKPQEAVSCFDEAERALNSSKEGIEKIAEGFMLACNRAIACEHLGDYTASLAQWDKAAGLAEQIPSGYRYVSSSLPLEKTAALLGKVLTLAVKGDVDRAIELCRHVLSAQPDNAIASSRMGYLLLRAERYHEAIPWCTRALQLDGRDINSLANLGASLLGVGKIEQARSALQQALDLAPTHPPALYSMGTLLLQNGSADQAIHHLRKAVSINPQYSEAWNHLGIALIQAHQPGYRECFERALRADRNNQMALRNLIGVIQEEDKSSPVDALASALISAGIFESELQVAQSLFSQRAFSEALTLFERVLARDKSNTEARLGKGSCLHRLGRSREAGELFEALEREHPDDFLVCHNLGAILAEIGDTKRAISSYERALEIDPLHAETWYGLATLLYWCDPGKRVGEALDCLNKAIQLQPHLAQAHGMRGRILYDLDRNAQALESYDRALALSPGMPGEMFGRGLVLLKLGRPIEAATAFEERYRLDPSCTRAAANQVVALAMARQIEQAHSVLRQALEQHPKDQHLLMAASQLHRIQ